MPERESEWANLRARLFSRVPCIKGDQYHALKWIFNLAWDTHKHQERADGSPYWSHIRAIIDKLETLGIVDPMIWALALGHDVFENSQELGQREGETYSDFATRTKKHIESEVGPRLGPRLSVDLIALTKPKIDGEQIKTETERMNTYVENLYWSSSSVILVKMVDRWHNLQTLDPLPEEKREEQCIETGVYMLDLFEEIEDNTFPHVYSVLKEEIVDSLDHYDREWGWHTDEFVRNLRNQELFARKSHVSAEII